VEQLNPGTTQTLLTDYVAEREHQRQIQQQAVDIDRESFRSFAAYQNRQLIAAFVLVVLVAAGGIVLIATGSSVKGFVTLIFELSALAGVFLGRQVLQAKSDDDDSTPAR
jgi:uncharacterized membrane protein